MSAWPRSVCTTRRSAPPERRCVAKAWRSTCGDRLSASSPALRGHALEVAGESLPGQMAALARCREQPFAADARRTERFAIGLERGRCRIVERNEALSPALSADGDQLPARLSGVCRQADQLGDTEPRRVEKFEQRPRPQCRETALRRQIVGLRRIARGGTAGVRHRRRVRIFGRCRRGFGLSAVAVGSSARRPSASEEPEELPEGREAARLRGRREAPPVQVAEIVTHIARRGLGKVPASWRENRRGRGGRRQACWRSRRARRPAFPGTPPDAHRRGSSGPSAALFVAAEAVIRDPHGHFPLLRLDIGNQRQHAAIDCRRR